MLLRCRLKSPLAIGILCTAALTRQPQAQETQLHTWITGRVVSRGTPIPDAQITLVGTPTTVVTDSAGRFRLAGLAPGLTVLRVLRIGYKGQYLQTTLAPGTASQVDIELEPGPYFLPDIVVRGGMAKAAKPMEYAWTTKYDDFFHRRWLGMPGGTFITAEDIRRQPAMHTAELLKMVPGTHVIVRFPGPQGTEVYFSRCTYGHVGVWVDGRKINWQPKYQEAPSTDLASLGRMPTAGEVEASRRRFTELADVLDDVVPLQIEFMEIYRGIGSIPGDFSGGCGAIVIWTK